MPGPRRKHKNKGSSKPKTPTLVNTRSTGTSAFLCCTLEEDEVTRCGQPATEGHPKPDRCKVHHGQYRIMYQKYKEASKIVDAIKQGSELPTKEEIGRYTNWHAALEKARLVREHLEAIRVEKTGREIHQKRFFLKIDDGHKHRLKLLQREMVKAVDAVDALQARAFELYRLNSPLHAMENIVQSTTELDGEDYFKLSTDKLVEMANSQEGIRDIPELNPDPTPDQGGDEDLIELSLLGQKEEMIAVFEPLFNFELFASLHVEEDKLLADSEQDVLEIQFFIQEQFARRIILNEPTLFMKALDKVSFKDLVFSDDFSLEDLFRFMNLFMRPLGFPLRWFKDAVLDALAMSRYGTAANVGSPENRFPLLGGWVFNRAHTASMSNEAWWHLLKALEPPGNMENRFVRLCNNFDDLIGFLSFGALGYFPSPAFCSDPSRDFEDPSISRKHLSLSGVIVTDMVGSSIPPQLCGPLPTTKKAKKQGYTVWAEAEHRAYLFGAVRDDPDDPFTHAFVRELRARPDLFQVVLRSETAPGRQVETFGSGPLNDQALPALRMRNFDAPTSFSPPPSPPDGKWDVAWSAKDVLFGSRREMQGYLIMLARELKGQFFRFKTFPVKYVVILDTVPNRDMSVLARNVSWAALRAGGYGYGEYTLRKYAIASDKLFEKCANERLGWLPKEFGWKMTKMEEQLNDASLLGRCTLM